MSENIPTRCHSMNTREVEPAGNRAISLRSLLSRPEPEQVRRGYFHTLREILQQPRTWIETSRVLMARAGDLQESVEQVRSILLTGSGSSQFAGECACPFLRKTLMLPAAAIGSGALLTHPDLSVPPQSPFLMISLARSGDSPESCESVSTVLRNRPDSRHLILTCNREGRLANAFNTDPRVKVVVLPDATNDRSLVMTSSFTNLVVASACLALRDAESSLRTLIEALSGAAETILGGGLDALAHVALQEFSSVLFLASGPSQGAAKEAALKMAEMTAGRVWSSAETFLGLRHGPLASIHSDTLIVGFLSCDQTARAYEEDLIRELTDKRLGMAKVLFGQRISPELVRPGDVAIECPQLPGIVDVTLPLLGALVGQGLAFFRCLGEGLAPDSPSESGIVNRVVTPFPLHSPTAVEQRAP